MANRSRSTLLIASLATLATFLDTTILYVAFPDITATFAGTGASELSWVLNAYTIVFAALLIPAGKLADRLGRRRVFLAGSIVFTVASMACGFAPNAELLIVFRIIQAMGAAALIPASLALVMHAFTHDQLPRAVAIWGAAGAVAGALGPTLGAAIGLLPAALATGIGSQAQKPLARVVVGGMLTAAFLILVVLPVLYELAHRSEESDRQGN